jgi:hypothetical protein
MEAFRRVTAGVTLDAGALIALRIDRRVIVVLARPADRDLQLCVRAAAQMGTLADVAASEAPVRGPVADRTPEPMSRYARRAPMEVAAPRRRDDPLD